MQDEKTHEAGKDVPETRPSARERYAKERKALRDIAQEEEDPLLDLQLKYDLLPMGHDL